MSGEILNKEYAAEFKKLNSAQREAVESIEGPVMVVAGPGTGKTQILALRIGNILLQTDVKADSILCLTFTNSAVEAMKSRLVRYIGETGEQVGIFTFHSFGMQIIGEHFKVLGFSSAPKLLEDTDAAIFFHEILEENDWEYLRPRGDSARYYSDLKSLISILSRERVTREHFLSKIEEEIQFLENSEENISTRGESKGKLKKEVIVKIESLERTKEVAKFIDLYERKKREKNVLDYDDVLMYLVKIVEISPDAQAELREKYLYVLIDEHQDSNRVQNEFLIKVWGDVERPDIFVVGDDRQLIYGFSGASIEHFVGFKRTFKEAKLIPLLDNYRSTQVILDASHALLQSVMSDKKLKSQSKEHYPIRLVEASSPRAEIIACALDIKEKVKAGVKLNECAILVPKNKQVRSALKILHSLNLPVSSLDALNLFDQEEMRILMQVFKVVSQKDGSALALSLFNKFSGVSAVEAHDFLMAQNMRQFSVDSFIGGEISLFGQESGVERWKIKISRWIKDAQSSDLPSLIKAITEQLFEDTKYKNGPVSSQDILNTLLALLTKEMEKNPNMNLLDFTSLLSRLESFGEEVPLVMNEREGIKVLTMHSSKGLEFDYVWIAHMDEWSLGGRKHGGFTLPEAIRDVLEEKDVDGIKRKLYVAITRAKRFCTLSYANNSSGEREQELSRVIAELPEEVFQKEKVAKIEEEVETSKENDLSELKKSVMGKYSDRYVSASLLNNFFECPWKWYFSNLLQLPSAPVETLEFGIAAHAVIDAILKLKKIPTNEEIEKIVKEIVSKSRLTDERIRIRIDREVKSLVHAWVKNRLPSIKPSHKTEESVSVNDKRFPHLKIYGKIDLIENLGGEEVRVTDFKTGRPKKKSDIEKLDEEGRMGSNLRQLAMYSYLLSKNPKWKADVRESRLEFLEAKDLKESIYDRVIGTSELELLLKDIKDYDELVKNGQWPDRPCNYNSYGKNTECEYCKLAEVYRGPLSSQPK